jgi:L-amino acid N-acyltransferase YncA
MIRKVEARDARAINDIYAYYITETTITFETEPLPPGEMLHRIETFAAHGPYFVYEEDGRVLGYCYAHQWKPRAAYAHSFEITIYLAHDALHRGIGTQLLNHLIADCRQRGIHALIACITEGNEASIAIHEKFGFRQASCYREVGYKFGRWLDVTDYELILK